MAGAEPDLAVIAAVREAVDPGRARAAQTRAPGPRPSASTFRYADGCNRGQLAQGRRLHVEPRWTRSGRSGFVDAARSARGRSGAQRMGRSRSLGIDVGHDLHQGGPRRPGRRRRGAGQRAGGTHLAASRLGRGRTRGSGGRNLVALRAPPCSPRPARTINRRRHRRRRDPPGMVPAVIPADAAGRPRCAAPSCRTTARRHRGDPRAFAAAPARPGLRRAPPGSALTQQSVGPTLLWLARHEARRLGAPCRQVQAPRCRAPTTWLATRLGAGRRTWNGNWALGKAALFELQPDGALTPAAAPCANALCPPGPGSSRR